MIGLAPLLPETPLNINTPATSSNAPANFRVSFVIF